ncbi:MAG: ParA family protein [Candidatus Hodarchaeales archaeon]
MGRKPYLKIDDLGPNEKSTCVAFCQYKGGVGKTTLARGIGASLVKSKVCLIDMDPQGNLTKSFDIIPKTPFYSLTKGIGDILDSDSLKSMVDKISKGIYYVKYERGVEVYVIPYQTSGNPLSSIIDSLGVKSRNDDRFLSRLKIVIESLKKKFHYIFIDMPPASNDVINSLCFRSVDQIVVPVDSYQAISNIPGLVGKVNVESNRFGNCPDLNFVMSKWTTQLSVEYGIYPRNPFYWKCLNHLGKHFLKSHVKHQVKAERSFSESMNRRKLFSTIADELLEVWNSEKSFLDDFRSGNIDLVALSKESREEHLKQCNVEYRKVKFN